MQERIDPILRTACRLDRDRLLVVGVSGGADSLCLAHLLWKLGYPLLIAHFDHGLRPESEEDRMAVQAFALEAGLQFAFERQDVQAYADEQVLSVEEAARVLRYRFLFRQAEAAGAQAVAVAHTANDQVETVLMHLLRGAGLSGLSGMPVYSLPNPWSQSIPLVRPLLSTWREEVLRYNRDQGLVAREDVTNQDVRYYRNRLRHELLPYLQQYNPAVHDVLWRMANVLGEENLVLEQLTDEMWAECLLAQGEGYLALSAELLLEQAPGLQRRLLRRAVSRLRPGLRDISLADIDRALAFVREPPRSRSMDLTAGLRLLREDGKLILAVWEADLPTQGWPQVGPGGQHPLPVPGSLSLEGGWRLEAERVEAPEAEAGRLLDSAVEQADPFQAWLDPEALSLPLTVRVRQPGDRFQPLGMGGRSAKLSDFFINNRLPRRARERWPLVLSDDQIVWIPGLRLAHPFRLKPGDRAAVRLRLVRER